MRALTVKQPWAWAIMHGKRVENRVWQRPFRGTLAIHAGKGWDFDGEDSPLVQRAWRNAGNDLLHLDPKDLQMAMGGVIAVADLVDICSASAGSHLPARCDCGPWAARGQYHWQLANVRPLAEPVPCKGALGLWRLPEDVEAAVRGQLAGAEVSRG